MSVAAALLDWYAKAGRANLPWRTVRDPYRTVVSEFMLQQTQVERVTPKFEAFLARFPDFRALHEASTADVLRAWQGLGYNSRAVRLKAMAAVVQAAYNGKLPRDTAELRALPGMGPYTASAVRAFAYDLDDIALDTNIRRVTHRLKFGIEHPPAALPREIDASARAMLPAGCAHDWNSALMDLGATICTARAPKCGMCPLRAYCIAAPVDAAELERRRAASARRKPAKSPVPFVQTNRFARGRIVDRLRALAPGQAISLLDLRRDLEPVLPAHSLLAVENTLEVLERDGIVRRSGESVALTE